ncbi:hypothetical protein NLI96_g7573 [Meripilus lineatus]|uniref:Uncharacterized protein n=1 Tax=Meripilus lineatus TaxID=2056292 RepID=A0AAD5UYU6_9APHY|nr:hypothetical protein NLI96_g7573 [Physisporinus lineatus]
MSRLASFRGPSTPTSSPVRSAPQSTPASPSRAQAVESTYHRKVRSILYDIRTVTENWEDIVLVDGLKAAKSLVDTRTDLDNELSSLPPGTQPQYPIVGPKLNIAEKRIAELDGVIVKLRKQFQKLNTLVENMEGVLFEASKAKGWKWCRDPIVPIASSIPDILVPYHRSLDMHIQIVSQLRSHSVSFETSRTAITNWVAQPHLEEGSWEAQWEDLCAVEIERWGNTK